MYFTQNPFNASFDVVYNWNFQITTGNNYLYLPQPVSVNKGNFILLTQTTGRVAIDISGNATYSDLAWKSPIWSKLSPNSNWRFYLIPLINFSSYQTNFNIIHAYKSIGLYNLSITFSSSNQTYQQTVNVTDCKLFNYLMY